MRNRCPGSISRRTKIIAGCLMYLCMIGMLGFLTLVSPRTSHAATGFVVTEEVSGSLALELPKDMPKSKYADGVHTKTTYISETGLRVEENNETTLLFIEGGGVKVFVLNPSAKTADDQSDLGAMMYLIAFFAPLDCDDNGNCREKPNYIKPTDEWRNVGKWKARKTKVAVLEIPATAWLTKDSPDLIAAEKMRNKFHAKAAGTIEEVGNNLPIKLATSLHENILNKYGAAVMTEAQMGPMKSATRILRVDKKDLSPDLFKPPKGYRVTKKAPM